jgi:hypothetical protein
VVGSAGLSASLLNQTISACSPSTSIVNYTNQKQTDSAGNTVDVAVPVYKTVNSCANLANISFNEAPDMLAKAAFDPGFGHYEVFGMAASSTRPSIPAKPPTATSTAAERHRHRRGRCSGAVHGGRLSNNITSSAAWAAACAFPSSRTSSPSAPRACSDPAWATSALPRSPMPPRTAWGELVPIHNLSGLLTAEVTPNPRLQLYFYYGGDYAGREDEANSRATTLGA